MKFRAKINRKLRSPAASYGKSPPACVHSIQSHAQIGGGKKRDFLSSRSPPRPLFLLQYCILYESSGNTRPRQNERKIGRESRVCDFFVTKKKSAFFFVFETPPELGADISSTTEPWAWQRRLLGWPGIVLLSAIRPSAV